MLLLRPVTTLVSLYQYYAKHCPLSGIRIRKFFEVNTTGNISTAGFQVIMWFYVNCTSDNESYPS